MPPRFPVSDHCDGRRFFNPDPDAPAGRPLRDVIRWARGRRPTPWPARLDDRAWPFPATPAREALALTFLGHSTFLLRAGGRVLITDPVFAERAGPFGRLGPRRVRPAALALEALPRVDLILQSHNHYDHLDLAAHDRLAHRDAPRVVTPLGNRAYLPRLARPRTTELDWWEGSAPLPDVRVTAVPAQHFSARTPWDRNRALWAGFVVEVAGWRVYFAGDTGYGPHFAEIGRRFPGLDVALLPIGAYEPRWFMRPVHVDPEEAVRAHLEMGVARSFGLHFGTFQLTDEGIDAPLRGLSLHRTAAGLGPAAFDALAHGETLVLPRPGRPPAASAA